MSGRTVTIIVAICFALGLYFDAPSERELVAAHVAVSGR